MSTDYEVQWKSAAPAASPLEAAEHALGQITEHACHIFRVRKMGSKAWVEVDLVERTVDGKNVKEN